MDKVFKLLSQMRSQVFIFHDGWVHISHFYIGFLYKINKLNLNRSEITFRSISSSMSLKLSHTFFCDFQAGVIRQSTLLSTLSTALTFAQHFGVSHSGDVKELFAWQEAQIVTVQNDVMMYRHHCSCARLVLRNSLAPILCKTN
jgi:hypothetical protein